MVFFMFLKFEFYKTIMSDLADFYFLVPYRRRHMAAAGPAAAATAPLKPVAASRQVSLEMKRRIRRAISVSRPVSQMLASGSSPRLSSSQGNRVPQLG